MTKSKSIHVNISYKNYKFKYIIITNMTKQDFIKKFPDIKVQQFETETILSKQEIMDIVEQATRSMDMGLVYY